MARNDDTVCRVTVCLNEEELALLSILYLIRLSLIVLTNGVRLHQVLYMMKLKYGIKTILRLSIQEAPQDQEAADGDVQKSSIRQTRVFLTEYGAIWRREFFLPPLMIEY